nr:NAD-binding protein [Phytohalomonas tamaricis]
MGQKVWPVGEAPERANVVKIGANFMLASAIEAMAEASTLTRAYGVSAHDFLDIVTNTLFASPAYQGYGKAIAEEKFEPAGFKMTLGYKDVGLALSAAGDERVPLPLAGVVRDRMLDAIANGDGDKDWAGLATVAARQAHLDKRGTGESTSNAGNTLQSGDAELAVESDEMEKSERTSWLRRSAKGRKGDAGDKPDMNDINDTAEQVDTREEPVKEPRKEKGGRRSRKKSDD